jgi:hypothetical protein
LGEFAIVNYARTSLHTRSMATAMPGEVNSGRSPDRPGGRTTRMTEIISSAATVDIDRSARYARQLVTHLSRRYGGEWTAENGEGWVDLQDGRATVVAKEDVLNLTVRAKGGDLDRLEEVVGSHLVRLGGDLKPVVTWERSDSSSGTRQPSE